MSKTRKSKNSAMERRLLGGTSALALLTVATLTIGVPVAAQAQTPVTGSNVTLNAANNPFVVNSGVTVTGTTAITGNTTGATWTLTNNGTVSGSGTGRRNAGISLYQSGKVTNGSTTSNDQQRK